MQQFDCPALERRFFCRPDAVSYLSGSKNYPEVRGVVSFRQTSKGVLVSSEVYGLPDEGTHPCESTFFAMHIHDGTRCTGNETDPFADADGHFNLDSCAHPHHAGDLPPLLSNSGMAFGSVLTERFTLGEVLGKTVIVHRQPDDFKSQPSGGAGEKIACGVISFVR